MKTTLEINKKQFDYLSGFFVHVWCSNFEGTSLDSKHWASTLDSLNIPWWVQNQVADLAEKRENVFFYFRTIFKSIGVTVKDETSMQSNI